MQGTHRQLEGTHLFLVRLQAEELDEGDVQWYGRVQRVVSGETYPFVGWPDLIDHLLAMLHSLPVLPNPTSDKPGTTPDLQSPRHTDETQTPKQAR